ncbi:MAG: hypothetical protein L6265_07410 [Thermoplasmatales archaeon]|nr:hypothetical protein [Thermoplasmatales archaeon]
MGIKCEEIKRREDQRYAEESFRSSLVGRLQICPKEKFRVPFMGVDDPHIGHFQPEEVKKALQTLPEDKGFPDEHKQLKDVLKSIKGMAQQMKKTIMYMAFLRTRRGEYGNYYVVTLSQGRDIVFDAQKKEDYWTEVREITKGVNKGKKEVQYYVIDAWYEEEGPYRMENVNAVKIVYEDGYEKVIRNRRPVVGTVAKGVTIHGIEAFYNTKTNKVLKCKIGYLYKHYVHKDSRVLGGGYIDPADSRQEESVGMGWYIVGKTGGGAATISAKRFEAAHGVYTGSNARVGAYYDSVVKKIEMLKE